MWALAQLRSEALGHSARTAVAAMVSLLVARLFRLPEAYWAPIATLIVVQSEFGAAWKLSVRRFAGAALGASVGALVATYFGLNVFAFGVGVFLLGLLCALMRRAHPRLPEYFDRTAYGYGSITLAIVVLVVHYQAAWNVALHRFIEVSTGIAVGLAFMTLSPNSQLAPHRRSKLWLMRLLS
ncbi:MAG TPA: FUSC family protein [Pyrinomonadaceae bacterium]|nr:FUSC family protein [Pyrinomonadaceae bacterium]